MAFREDNEDDFETAEKHLLADEESISKPRRSGLFVKHGLQVVNVAALLMVSVLLIHSTLQASNDRRHCASDRTIETTYGSDERYMSLNAKYDVLWEDVSGESDAVILLPDSLLPPDLEDLDETGQSMARWGSISMSVQNP